MVVQQTNKIKRRLLVPAVLLTIASFYCLTTPLEYFFHLAVFGWTKFIIAIPFILILTISTGWTKKKLWRKAFLGLVTIVIVYSRDISDRIFLGKEIAYRYSGQDAGFEELYLFRSGKCKITYGGILGVRENHYGTFRRTETTVLVDSEANILDLNGLTINIDNIELKIKDLNE